MDLNGDLRAQMSVVRVDLESPESRARAIRREADEPRSQVVRFGPDKPLKLDAGSTSRPSNSPIRPTAR